MRSTAKSRAEQMFSASKKKQEEAQKTQEAEQRKRAEHVAALRALRLAKEAAEKDAADQAAAEKASAKGRKKPGLPQAHRHSS